MCNEFQVGDKVKFNCGCICEITKIYNGMFDSTVVIPCRSVFKGHNMSNNSLNDVVLHLKEGDEVEVRDSGEEEWYKDKIFLMTLKDRNHKYLVAKKDEYLRKGIDDDLVDCASYRYIRTKPRKKEILIEVTYKANGKTIDPSSLSEKSRIELAKNI